MSPLLSANTELAVTLGDPQEVGCISITEDRQIHPNDKRSLRVFRGVQPNTNLLQGSQRYKRASGADPFHNHPNRLDRVLRMCLEEPARAALTKGKTQVVTYRGILAKILLGKKIELNASLSCGTLFLEEYDPAPTKLHTFVSDGEYIGSHFEALCTGTQPGGALTLHERWYAGMTVGLGEVQILYAGEVDCVEDIDAAEPRYVEIKSKKVGSKPIEWRRWCMQSFLSNMDKIFIGHHNNGVLESTETVLLEDLKARLNWTSRVYSKPHQTLRGLRQRLIESHSPNDAVWRVLFTGNGAQIRVLDNAEVIRLARGDDRVGILPGWFVDEMINGAEEAVLGLEALRL